jgi:hypothetical protein
MTRRRLFSLFASLPFVRRASSFSPSNEATKPEAFAVTVTLKGLKKFREQFPIPKNGEFLSYDYTAGYFATNLRPVESES